METNVFKTEREFKKKFPSGLFVCSNCKKLVQDKKTCNWCGWRADGLFKTWGKGFKYAIEDINQSDEIFAPVEIYKAK